MWIELEDLYERRSYLREKISKYIDGDINPHHGDGGYQALLEQLEVVEIEIAETFEKG